MKPSREAGEDIKTPIPPQVMNPSAPMEEKDERDKKKNSDPPTKKVRK